MEIEKLIEIFSGWEDELKKGFLKLKNEFVPDFIPIVGYPAEKMVRGCVDAEIERKAKEKVEELFGLE